MNIGYTPRYSEIIRGLKQSSSIKDQDNKLIFTFPILCEKSVSSNLQLIRKFISVSILKELIVNNSINIIKLSSYVPGYGETEKSINAQEIMVNSMKGLNSLNNSQSISDIRANMYNDSDLAQRKYELQNKINEKTAYIQQFLESDAKLKNLLPYIEILTLNNFINVPVIVGTKGYPMEQAPLFLIILGSLGTNKPLNSPNNVSYIIAEYKKYKPEEFWKILNTLESKQSTKGIFKSILENRKLRTMVDNTWIRLKKIYNFVKDTDQKIGNKVNTPENPNLWSISKRIFSLGIGVMLMNNFKNSLLSQRKALTDTNNIRTTSGTVGDIRNEIDYNAPGNEILMQLHVNNMYTPLESLAIYNISSSKLKDAAIIWDKVLNPNTIKKEYGIDFTSGGKVQSATVIEHNLPNYTSKVPILKKISVDDTSSNMVGLSLKSIYNMLTEINSGMLKDNSKLIDEFTNKLSESIDKIESNYIRTSVGQMKSYNPEDIIDIIKEIKTMQKIDINEMVSLNNKLYSSIDRTQLYTKEFSFNNYQNFMKTMANNDIEIVTKTNYYFKYITKVLNDTNSKSLRSALKDELTSVVNAYFNELTSYDGFDIFETAIRRCLQESPEMDNSDIILVADKFKKYYNQLSVSLRDYIIHMLEFTFALGCVSLLVDYVNFIEADIKAFDSDVTSEYNYTLVIPLELVISLNAIIVAKSFKKILESKNEMEYSRLNLSEPYIKGMVKYMYNNLGIPNLFVIDSKSNTVYYRMMYQSDVIKTNLNNMNSFVESNTKVTLSSNNMSSNTYF